MRNAIQECVAAGVTLAFAAPAMGQAWTGGYIGGHVGLSRLMDRPDDTVVFDRNLDGTFVDTITTAAGADAFSPGFCVGAAATSQPACGCTQDEKGLDAGAFAFGSMRLVMGYRL